jgi:hypothetical protein
VPLADEFWSVASQVVSERGYLVIGFSEGAEQPKLGSSLDNVLGFRPQQRHNGYGARTGKTGRSRWKPSMFSGLIGGADNAEIPTVHTTV